MKLLSLKNKIPRSKLTYSSWHAMKTRCLNSNHPSYNGYGGRGITVCERWLIFKNFLEDMGERPEGKTLDRIDGTKGYYKENCRWATKEEQVANKTHHKTLITHCPKGHEYTKENTYYRDRGTARLNRECKTCYIIRNQKRYK